MPGSIGQGGQQPRSHRTIAAADACYTALHTVLHRRLAEAHLFHHTGVFVSFASSAWLDPIDGGLEFAGPVVPAILLLGTRLVPGMYDPFAIYVSVALLSTYYLCDHDYGLNLAHVRHHTNSNSDYYAYAELHFWKKDTLTARDPEDRVRAMVFDRIEIVK